MKETLDSMYLVGKYNQTPSEDFPFTNKHNELCKENSVSSSTDSKREYAEQQVAKNAPRPTALWGVAIAAVVCFAAAYLMWCTNIFSEIIHQSLIIRNNTLRYEMWRHQPIQTYLKVYAFNYTNVQAFEEGQDPKLKLQQLGPYTYTEAVDRINIKFNDNGTVSYQEKKIYRFAPHLSAGGQFDPIVVPNLPFMATIAMTESSYALTRYALSTALQNIKAGPLLRVPLDDFLWGYDDNLATITSQFLQIQHDVSFNKFGVLASKNGTQNDVLTIHTGQSDITKLGLISRFNGNEKLPHWKTPDCNRIDGSDGSMFSPTTIHPNSTLYLYTKDMCRRIPLTSEEHYRQSHNIRVLRYTVPEDVFDNTQQSNSCFCLDESCPPSGVFDASPCAYGAPIYTSLPHFLYGNSSLQDAFEGLQPKVEEHVSYAEVEPVFGIPITGVSRLQLNVMLKRFPGITIPRPYKNGLIMPVVWMEFGSEELPADMSSFIRNLLFLIQTLDVVLSYGSVVMIFASLLLLIRMLLKRHQVNQEKEKVSKMAPTSSRFPLVRRHETV